MKRTALILLIVICSLNGFSQTQFTISGKITGAPNAWIRLSYLNSAGKYINESCSLNKDAFTFKGEINGGFLANLTAYTGTYKSKGDDDPNTVSIFIEPGVLEISGSYGNLKNINVKGSASEEEYKKMDDRLALYFKESAPTEKKFLSVNDEFIAAEKQKKSDKTLDSLNRILDSLRGEMETAQFNIVHQFIVRHYNSYVSAYELNGYRSSWPIDSVRKFYSKFSPEVKNCPYGKAIWELIASIDDNSPGKAAKNFISADVNGKIINLANFKGHYVLLDFWASWCVPCRQSIPHLKELFSKYSNSGFAVIGIADDDYTKNAWLQAIKKDQTELWPNVLRGRVETKNGPDISNSINDKYGVHVLPTKILIDKNGMIIGRYTGIDDADALDKKLAEVFK